MPASAIGEDEGAQSTRAKRLFIGVPFPDGLLGRAKIAQDRLRGLSGVRVLRPEQLHVTLVFLGEVDTEACRKVREIVRGVPASLGGTVQIDGYLCLPSARRARVVTLEVVDTGEVLARLFDSVAERLESAGLMQREERRFRPHVTIARVRRPRSIQPKFDGEPEAFPVRSVCLFESRLRPTGAEYTVLERTELQAGGSQA